MLTIEKTAKTVEEALSEALRELNVDENQVDYEVLEETSKGLFGFIGNKPAKIRVSVKKNSPIEIATKFLEDIFSAMNITVNIEKLECAEHILYKLSGDNLGILIGKHGQTLDSLQYLTNLAANSDMSEAKVKIIIDIEDYRKRREDTLCRLANRLADKVKRTGEKITLEPMNRHERKVIHTALQDDRRILTYSDGEEPFRKVVIALKR